MRRRGFEEMEENSQGLVKKKDREKGSAVYV